MSIIRKKNNQNVPNLNLKIEPKSTLVSSIVQQLIDGGYKGNLFNEAGMSYVHPENQMVDGEDFEENISLHWSNDYGDRRQEIVFIGLKGEMDEAAIREKLDACLVKNYLTAPEKFQKLKDPFPLWFKEAA